MVQKPFIFPYNLNAQVMILFIFQKKINCKMGFCAGVTKFIKFQIKSRIQSFCFVDTHRKQRTKRTASA